MLDKNKPNLLPGNGSILKALKYKEKTDQVKNSMMNDFANQFNLFRNTILSNQIDSENEDEKEDELAPDGNGTLSRTQTEIDKVNMEERVFWTKEKMEKIRAQLKTAKAKIFEKTRKDFQELFIHIDTGQKENIL